jgi:O-antigen/teichoic acid export membrane protein
VTSGQDVEASVKDDSHFALSRRASKNALFGLAAFAYSAVLALIITPLLVHGLGPTYYGIFALSSAAIGFVGMLDLGMGTTLVRFISTSHGRGDIEESRRLVQASAFFYSIVGIIGFFVMLAVALLFAGRLFDLHGTQLGVARFALIVSGAAFAVDTVAGTFDTIPLALQRNGVAATVRFVFNTVGGATAAGVMVAGLGLRWLVGAYAFLDVLGFVTALFVGKWILAGVSFRPRWDAERIRRLMTFSGWVFLANISAFVIFQFDRLTLGALASVSDVTYYAVPASMASYLYAATTSLAGIVIPATGDLIARGELLAVERLYRRASRLCLLFVASLAIPALVFAHPLLELWLGKAFATRSSLTLEVLILTFVLFSTTVVPYNVLVAGGFPRIVGVLNLCIAVVNVVFIFVLIPPYGATGAAIAYLVSVLLFPLFIWYAEKRVLQLRRPQWLSRIWRVLPALGVQAAACLVVRLLGPNAWVGLAATVLAVPVPVLVYFFSGLIDPDERAIFRELARR